MIYHATDVKGGARRWRRVVWVLLRPLWFDQWKKDEGDKTNGLTWPPNGRDHRNWDKVWNQSQPDVTSFIKTPVDGPAVAWTAPPPLIRPALSLWTELTERS